ncbi:MAG: hypothetical protein KME17_07250 [Cyanosarcina radialis HA8281-LM2]|jgi:hypothetical protein|nr:hypothetical protein [Cyanosarcina radialis HA8281-LM2]
MKQRLRAFIYLLSEGNLKVFGTIFITGLFVILARVLAPVQIASDQGLQLQAAHRLVQGLGLTVALSLNFDLNQPPNSEYLTHFPPAFSLLVASLLFFKMPLATALKIIYGLTTIVGWFCWAAIGSRLLSTSLKVGKFLLPLQYVIAVILPILYTPSWSTQGTDIFLWSGVPAIVLLLLHSSDNRFKNIFSISAGLLFGLLFAFRYNSIFLVLAAFLILLQVNFPRLLELSKNYTIFLASSCFFIVPVFIYNKMVMSGNILPSQATRSKGLLITEGIDEILKSLSMTSVLSGFIPTSFISHIQSYTLINYVYGLVWFSILLSAPFIVALYKKSNIVAIAKDTAIAISLLPISLIIYFIAAVFRVSYSPIDIARYYLPINFCLILIIYNLATLPNDRISLRLGKEQHLRARSLLQKISYFIETATYISICLFLVFNLFYRPAAFALKKFTTFTDLFLGITAVPKLEYPANKIITEYDRSLSVMEALAKEDANTLFFVQDAAILSYNNPDNYRRIPNQQFWERAFVSKATKMVWVIADPNCSQICTSQDALVGNSVPIDLALPHLKLLFVDPFNGTKIMISDLPDKYEFSRKR